MPWQARRQQSYKHLTRLCHSSDAPAPMLARVVRRTPATALTALREKFLTQR